MTIFKLNSNTISKPTSATTLFPTLPLELREQIYHHALLPASTPAQPHRLTLIPSDLVFGPSPLHPSFLPSLCHVNEPTRIDISLWFLRNTEFIILYPHDIIYFSHFLSTFPGNEGFSALRKLDLQFFGRSRPDVGRENAYMAFLRKCAGLTHVSIKFEVWNLVKEQPNKSMMGDGLGMEIMDDIEVAFGLEGFFGMENLVRLTIEVFPKAVAKTSVGLEVVVPDCWPKMERVAGWIRQGFSERGRHVDVELVEGTSSGLRFPGGRGV
jgi:hypothetical protein